MSEAWSTNSGRVEVRMRSRRCQLFVCTNSRERTVTRVIPHLSFVCNSYLYFCTSQYCVAIIIIEPFYNYPPCVTRMGSFFMRGESFYDSIIWLITLGYVIYVISNISPAKGNIKYTECITIVILNRIWTYNYYKRHRSLRQKHNGHVS